MAIKDVYNPQYQGTTFGDQMSDQWVGTNKVAQKDMANSLEQLKATSLNKYEWNKQGMLKAGINPLVNSSALSGADGAPSSPSPRTTKLGTLIEKVADKSFKILEKQINKKDDAIKVISQIV